MEEYLLQYRKRWVSFSMLLYHYRGNIFFHREGFCRATNYVVKQVGNLFKDLKIYHGDFNVRKRHLKMSLCFIIILSRSFYVVHFLQFGRSILEINWQERLQSENRE